MLVGSLEMRVLIGYDTVHNKKTQTRCAIPVRPQPHRLDPVNDTIYGKNSRPGVDCWSLTPICPSPQGGQADDKTKSVSVEAIRHCGG